VKLTTSVAVSGSGHWQTLVSRTVADRIICRILRNIQKTKKILAFAVSLW